MAAEAAVMVVGVTVAAAEVAITDAGATAAEVAVVRLRQYRAGLRWLGWLRWLWWLRRRLLVLD